MGNDQTRKELAQAAEIIQQNIRKFATPLTRIEIDDNPTSANRSYNFTLTVDRLFLKKFAISMGLLYSS